MQVIVLFAWPQFLREIEAAASLDARVRGCQFKVAPGAEDIQIVADAEILAGARGELAAQCV
jgi:hypothetical protein